MRMASEFKVAEGFAGQGHIGWADKGAAGEPVVSQESSVVQAVMSTDQQSWSGRQSSLTERRQ